MMALTLVELISMSLPLTMKPNNFPDPMHIGSQCPSRNHQSFFKFLGGGMPMMALTLVGLISMSLLLTMKPNNFSDPTHVQCTF